MARAVTIIATSDEPPLVKRQAARLTLDGRRVLPRSGPAGPRACSTRSPGLPRPSARSAWRRASRRRRGPIRRRPSASCRRCSSGQARAAQRFPRRHHRGVHGAGPGRRHGRAGGGCRARDPGRPRGPGSIDRRARPVPADRRAQERVARVAGLPFGQPRMRWRWRRRKAIADYEAMATMIRIGAYRSGSDAETDRAIQLRPELEELPRPAACRAGQPDRQLCRARADHGDRCRRRPAA